MAENFKQAQSKLTKAIFKNADKGTTIKVMFNPKEYSFNVENLIVEKNGMLDFDRLKTEEFQVTLFYDSYPKGEDVRKQTGQLAKLMEPTIAEGKVKRPPICLFSWGNFTYRGVVTRVEQKYTLFYTTGIPARAEVVVKMRPVMSQKDLKKAMGAEACLKLWKVKAGQRLDSIAAEVFRDHRQWRAIAIENQIADPLRFPLPEDIGRILRIPEIYGLEDHE